MVARLPQFQGLNIAPFINAGQQVQQNRLAQLAQREALQQRNRLAELLPGAIQGDQQAIQGLAGAGPEGLQVARQAQQFNQAQQQQQIAETQRRARQGLILLDGVKDQASYEAALDMAQKLDFDPNVIKQLPQQFDPNIIRGLKAQLNSSISGGDFSTKPVVGINEQGKPQFFVGNKQGEFKPVVGFRPPPDKKAAGDDKKTLIGLAKDYRAASKDFKKVKDAFGRVNSVFQTNKRAISEFKSKATRNNKDLQDIQGSIEAFGDMALIFNYMKMLDPGSTVREGEFANAQNTAGVEDAIRNTYNRLLSGARLNDNQRAGILAQSQGQFNTALEGQKQFIQDQIQLATDLGLPITFIPKSDRELLNSGGGAGTKSQQGGIDVKSMSNEDLLNAF